MNPLDELTKLTTLFPESQPLFQRVEYIPSSTTPEPYKSLLVHEHHMTVTMERMHGGPVNVQVLATKYVDDTYSRKITLSCVQTGMVVQFGIVRFNFAYVTDAVRDEIVSGNIPLGRVLINHNVLRHIDLGAILRLESGPALASYFGTESGEATYGRLATIFCNGRPAVDLLEVSRPLPPDMPPVPHE